MAVDEVNKKIHRDVEEEFHEMTNIIQTVCPFAHNAPQEQIVP